MSDFKLTYEPDIDPPETWEEVKALDRPQKIRACRHFLRLAAVRLCEEAGLHPDDIVMLFDAIPEWVSHQRHEWKRQQHEKDAAWRCNNCTHIAKKEEFFIDGKSMAACPRCGKSNAHQISADSPASERAQGRLVELGAKNKPVTVTVEQHLRAAGIDPKWNLFSEERPPNISFKGSDVDMPQSQAEPGDGKAAFCACDNQPCPVCDSMGRKNIIIEHHSCITCETLFCPTCHGIVTAGSSRAFDSCARCKC